MRWIDPPSGYEYGFPMPFDPLPGQSIDAWLLENGYPQSEVAKWHDGVPCRVWGEAETDPELLFETKVICRIRNWAGGQAEAENWYRSHTIPVLGGRTASEVVKAGDGAAVIAYINHVSMGGFA